MLTVQIIGDSELPERQPWALVEFDERHIRLFVKRSALGRTTMVEAHAAFRKLKGRRPRGVAWERPLPVRQDDSQRQLVSVASG